MGAAVIHRCGECGHKSGDHLGSIGWGGGGQPRRGFCSMGGCPCNLSEQQVKALNPDTITVQTWSAADRGTGKWWTAS